MNTTDVMAAETLPPKNEIQDILKKIKRRNQARTFQDVMAIEENDEGRGSEEEDDKNHDIEKVIETMCQGMPRTKSGREQFLRKKLAKMDMSQMEEIRSYMRQEYSSAHVGVLDHAIADVLRNRKGKEEQKMAVDCSENDGKDLSHVHNLVEILNKARGLTFGFPASA